MYFNAASAPPSVPLRRVARAVVARLRRVRAHPVLNATAFEESWRERAGHAVDPDHRPHIVAALDWLGHAQDATSEGGIARGYSLGWNPLFGSRPWQPADPWTTGDIIPLLYSAARQVRHARLLFHRSAPPAAAHGGGRTARLGTPVCGGVSRRRFPSARSATPFRCRARRRQVSLTRWSAMSVVARGSALW